MYALRIVLVNEKMDLSKNFDELLDYKIECGDKELAQIAFYQTVLAARKALGRDTEQTKRKRKNG